MSEETQLTKLGNLDPKIANTLSYLPIMSVNLFASIAFLATEEKDNERVRFHAAQSLVVIASLMATAVIFTILYVVVAVIAGIVDSIVGMGGMLSMLVGLVMSLGWLLYFAVAVLLPFGLTAMAFMEKRVRLPVISGIVEKIIGHGDGWTE